MTTLTETQDSPIFDDKLYQNASTQIPQRYIDDDDIVGDLIQSGANSSVYHYGVKNKYVLKVMNDDIKVAEVLREIEIMKYTHENILSIINLGKKNNRLTAIMEKGKDFLEVQNMINLSEADKRQSTIQIMKGVEFLHENHITHCDLKWENVLYFGNINNIVGGCLKICDFGFAHSPSWRTASGSRFRVGTNYGFGSLCKKRCIADIQLDNIGLRNGDLTYLGTANKLPEYRIYCHPAFKILRDEFAMGCMFYEMCYRHALYISAHEKSAYITDNYDGNLTKHYKHVRGNMPMIHNGRIRFCDLYTGDDVYYDDYIESLLLHFLKLDVNFQHFPTPVGIVLEQILT
tara:strand:- start:478 stop:1515 length:1038 start_codon:yes stop_codon:yes gene_type:complete